jgi:hypothetical protein
VTRLVCLIPTLAVFAACASRVQPAELWKDLGPGLIYPSSEILDTREGQAESTIAGGASASVGYLLGSDDQPSDVADFYATELAKLGWKEPADNEARARGIRTTAELSARSWRKGDLVFRLGILDVSHPAAEGPSEGFETVLRIDVIAQPAEPDQS